MDSLSKSRLAAIIEHSQDAIIAKDMNGIVKHWNKSAERMFGYSEAEMIGANIAVLAPPDHLHEMQMVLDQLACGQSINHFETVRQRKDGSLIEISLTVSPIRDTKGHIVGASKIARDISYEKATKRRLKESESCFRAAFEQAANGMAHVSRGGRWIRVNGRLCEMLLCKSGELIGSEIFDIVGDGAFRSAFADFSGLPASSAESFSFETACRRSDGVNVHMEIVVSMLTEPATGLDCLTMSFNDITGRKRAEAALREEEQRLHALQKLDVIGRLSAGVAHDFNNILQGIGGGLEMLLDEVPRHSNAYGLVDTALTSVKQGAMLTQHLLSYARKQVLLPQEVDLGAFFPQFERLLARTLGSHIKTSVSLAQDLPPLRVDLGQLQTALLNLAINASHAMPDGGSLRFDASSDLRDGTALVVIDVRDTGHGMDAATLAQAFEPFFTTKGNAGTGLGLSMVHGFACQSGGTVTIESRVGGGTMVKLSLPAVCAAGVPVQLGATPRHVLLVEDACDSRVITRAFLRREGYEVTSVETGEAAIALYADSQRFSALITDYGLPDTTGIRLIGELRRLRANLPAVLISGYLSFDRDSTLPDGVVKLVKPFSRDALLKAVAATIRTADPSSASPASKMDCLFL